MEYLEEVPPSRLEVLEDHSREVLARNTSPDVCFTWSTNPYRGCMHACAYCYARPTHEYLSMGAGTDFETRIVVKPHAPELLREAFERQRWQGETLVFSGVTDCYQPLEASLKLTRRCLEVCAEYRNPVGIITKAPLIERDIDVLQTLAREARLWVSVSVPFHNPELARAMEPYVATPKRRLQTIERLAAGGISVAVSVALIDLYKDRHFGQNKVGWLRTLETGSVEFVASSQQHPDGSPASHLFEGDSGGACLSSTNQNVLVGIAASSARNRKGEMLSVFTSIYSHRDWLTEQLEGL